MPISIADWQRQSNDLTTLAYPIWGAPVVVALELLRHTVWLYDYPAKVSARIAG